MKKSNLIFIEIIFLIFVFLAGFTGCVKTVKYDLNFIVNNEIYYTISTTGNEIIAMPENPTKENYIFDGWYWDNDTFENPFTVYSLLNQPLSSDMKVYAKWKNAVNLYNLNFIIDNEVYAIIKTSGDETITLPENPTKDNYTFAGGILTITHLINYLLLIIITINRFCLM